MCYNGNGLFLDVSLVSFFTFLVYLFIYFFLYFFFLSFCPYNGNAALDVSLDKAHTSILQTYSPHTTSRQPIGGFFGVFNFGIPSSLLEPD